MFENTNCILWNYILHTQIRERFTTILQIMKALQEQQVNNQEGFSIHMILTCMEKEKNSAYRKLIK